MKTNLPFGDLVLLLLYSSVVIYDTVGTTTTTPQPLEVTTVAVCECDVPCENCSDTCVCLQRCPDGAYYVTSPTTSIATTTSLAGTAVMNEGPETNAASPRNGTELHPNCRECSDAISSCNLCFENQSMVYCSSCSDGYKLSLDSTECEEPGEDSGFPGWAVAVIVVVSVLILVGAGVAIFFIVRRHSDRKPGTPPNFPPPEDL